MPAMDYKGATGVRARSDLSANPHLPPAPRLSFAEMLVVADTLARASREGRVLQLRPELSGRVA